MSTPMPEGETTETQVTITTTDENGNTVVTGYPSSSGTNYGAMPVGTSPDGPGVGIGAGPGEPEGV